MMKMPVFKKMRFWSLLLLGTLAVGLAGMNEARAAITYQSAGAVAYSGAGGAATSVAPAYPASIATGDLLVLIVGQKPATANGGGVTTPTGWTAITSLTGAGGYGTTLSADQGNTNVFAYYIIATGSLTGTLTVTLTDNDISWAQMYRLSNATGGWSVAGTTGSDTTAGNVSITMSADPGVTAGDYILGAMVIPTDVTTPAQFSAEALSQTGITFGTVAEIAEPDSGTGNDIGGFTYGAPVSSGTASAAPTLTATAGGTTTNVRGPGVFIRVRESASTTLGNGTDPANTSLAPGDVATMADAFTFQTSSGTDTISAVVVGLATGSSGGLSLVEVTNDAGTTVYGSVTDPASDTPSITLSTSTLTATTTLTQYKIRVTPKSHAAMPAPPGSTYSVTAKINSWTGTNTAAGSDTAGTTVTIDNLSSSIVTGATGTAGDGFVNLSWTNPGDAASVIVLRDTTTVATPAEGNTSYAATNLIGSTVVVCVGLITTCNDNTVTNGTTYLYTIHTRDSIGNYSVAVTPTGSPYTPAGPGCYSVATGNWDSSLTWASSAGGTPGTCPGTLLVLGVPDSSTPAYINFTTTSHTVTVNVSNAAAASVRIGAPGTGTAGLAIAAGTLDVGGSVTITGGTGTKKALLSFTTGTLKVGGTITESGATDVTFGTGTVEYDGTGAQTVRNYGYYNLTINKASGTATTSGNITIGNNLTLTTGTLNIAANSCDRGTVGGTFTLGSGSLLQIAAANLPANYSTVSIATTSTVEYNPSFNMTVPAPGGGANYGNLLLSNSGNRIFNAAMTVAGNLTTTGTVVVVTNAGITVNGNVDIGTGTSLDPKSYTHTFKGNYVNSGSTVQDGTNTSTILMNGTSAQAISGAGLWFYHLTADNALGVTASSSFSIAGNFTNTAGFGAGTTTTTFNGTTAQTLGGSATTFYGLVFNNAAGFTLNYDTTATNALTLSSGAVATGANTLIFSSTSTCTATRTSGYVNGKLRKSFTASVTDCNFEVGDNTNYTPVNVALTSVSCTGTCTVTASTTGTDHPQINASGIDSTASVNRYWTLVPAGTLTFTNATLTFTYIGGVTVDNDDTAIASTYIAQRYDVASTNWLGTNKTSSSSTSMVCYGPTTFGTTSYSDFAVGKPAASADSGAREREFIFNRELFY